MKFDVITVGGATEDISFYTREGVLVDNKTDLLRQKLLAFECDAKIRIDQTFESFGGGAANAAVNFSRLGLKVASLVAVGDDERGKRIINNFKKNKVDTSLIKKIKGAQTGFSFVLINSEKIVFSNRGANSKLSISEKDLGKLQNAKWAYITSLSGDWQDVLEKIFSVEGLKVAWNPGHIQLENGVDGLKNFISKTEILFVNRDEAIELAVSATKKPKRSYEVKELLETLKSWGPKIVVITSGHEGADAYDGENFYHQNIVKEKIRLDTTGVGDANNSSFLAGLEVYNGDIAKSMLLGARNTASSIGERGAQNGLLTKNDL